MPGKLIEKPVDNNLLLAQVQAVLRINSLQDGHKALADEVSSNFIFDRIVYESEVMEAVIKRARVLAQTSNTILIYGETGCGKEVFLSYFFIRSRNYWIVCRFLALCKHFRIALAFVYKFCGLWTSCFFEAQIFPLVAVCKFAFSNTLHIIVLHCQMYPL